MDYFSEKVVVITGGARGIGYAIAEQLGKRGGRIVVTDVDEETLDDAGVSLSNRGIAVHTVQSDVSDAGQCRQVIEESLEVFGRVDGVVNNAGVSIVAPLEECRPEPCKKLIEVNLLGSMYMSLAALQPLKASRGHLVFISSVSGVRAIPTGSVYSASKAALRSFAESLRVELGPSGVHVGVVSPGFTTSDKRKTVMRGDGTPRPINRPPLDTPEGVARAVAKLIEHRRREMVLTPMGKLTSVVQRISPTVLDFVLARKPLQN